MAKAWFKEWGWAHRPISWQGWLITFLALVFCIQVFITVDRHSHSTSDTLYGIFPFVVPVLLVWEWIASKTNGKKKS